MILHLVLCLNQQKHAYFLQGYPWWLLDYSVPMKMFSWISIIATGYVLMEFRQQQRNHAIIVFWPFSVIYYPSLCIIFFVQWLLCIFSMSICWHLRFVHFLFRLSVVDNKIVKSESWVKSIISVLMWNVSNENLLGDMKHNNIIFIILHYITYFLTTPTFYKWWQKIQPWNQVSLVHSARCNWLWWFGNIPVKLPVDPPSQGASNAKLWCLFCC